MTHQLGLKREGQDPIKLAGGCRGAEEIHPWWIDYWFARGWCSYRRLDPSCESMKFRRHHSNMRQDLYLRADALSVASRCWSMVSKEPG